MHPGMAMRSTELGQSDDWNAAFSAAEPRDGGSVEAVQKVVPRR